MFSCMNLYLKWVLRLPQDMERFREKWIYDIKIKVDNDFQPLRLSKCSSSAMEFLSFFFVKWEMWMLVYVFVNNFKMIWLIYLTIVIYESRANVYFIRIIYRKKVAQTFTKFFLKSCANEFSFFRKSRKRNMPTILRIYMLITDFKQIANTWQCCNYG